MPRIQMMSEGQDVSQSHLSQPAVCVRILAFPKAPLIWLHLVTLFFSPQSSDCWGIKKSPGVDSKRRQIGPEGTF